jgi:hypothetical protein
MASSRTNVWFCTGSRTKSTPGQDRNFLFSPTRREGVTPLPVVEFYLAARLGRPDLPGENPQHETPPVPTAMDGLVPR